MALNCNVTRAEDHKRVVLKTDRQITDPVWLDNGEAVAMNADGSFDAQAFPYGVSYGARVAKFRLN